MKPRPSGFASSSASDTATPGCVRRGTGSSACATIALILIAGLATSCRQNRAAVTPDPLAQAYDNEPDWSDSSKAVPLNYQQAQGKRVFYQYCVWCHADSTPAGPSNRSNLNPNPPLANDGATLNALSDDFMRNVITMGGAAAGKSASMPPWGKTLSQDDIEAVIAFYRAIAQPPYQVPARPGPKYSVR
ncbi:MAG: cytochrome c [Terriglobia bacterium]